MNGFSGNKRRGSFPAVFFPRTAAVALALSPIASGFASASPLAVATPRPTSPSSLRAEPRHVPFPVPLGALPGQAREGGCLDFAWALIHRLHQAGRKGYLIIFRWERGSGASAESGTHAMVLARGNDGVLYGVDNLLAAPKPVSGNSALEWTRDFMGKNIRVIPVLVRESSDTPPRRKLSSPGNPPVRQTAPGTSTLVLPDALLTTRAYEMENDQ